MRSADPLPNFVFVWISVVLIFWNLSRFKPEPAIDPSLFPGFAVFISLAFLVPLVLLIAAGRLLKGMEFRANGGGNFAQAGEASSEMDENFPG